MKKRYFILLEVLIALTLLILLSIPLIRNPLAFYKKELVDLKELELKRLERECFLEIKEKLFKNEVPLEILRVKNKREAPIFSLGKKKLSIPSFTNEDIDVTYRLWTDSFKETSPNELFLKLNVEIGLKKPFKGQKQNKHFVIVKKINPSS